MKYLYKVSTQISIFLFLIIVFSFFWWQTKFSTKKISIDLNDNKSNAFLKQTDTSFFARELRGVAC